MRYTALKFLMRYQIQLRVSRKKSTYFKWFEKLKLHSKYSYTF